MNKTVAKAFAWLLALTLSLAPPLPARAATAASGERGENLTWTPDENGVLTIEGSGKTWNFVDPNGTEHIDCEKRTEQC